MSVSTQTKPEHLSTLRARSIRTRRGITIFSWQYMLLTIFIFEYSVQNLSDCRMFAVERIWVHGRSVLTPPAVFRYCRLFNIAVGLVGAFCKLRGQVQSYWPVILTLCYEIFIDWMNGVWLVVMKWLRCSSRRQTIWSETTQLTCSCWNICILLFNILLVTNI